MLTDFFMFLTILFNFLFDIDYHFRMCYTFLEMQTIKPRLLYTQGGINKKWQPDENLDSS